MDSEGASLDPEDIALKIQLCLSADDPVALEMIWERYAPDLLGYLSGLHCSRLDAEDTLQEVFVTIAKKRASVAKARSLKPYLFQLARNVALNRIKHSKRIWNHAQALSDWLVPVAPDSQNELRSRQLEAALARLPEKQRVVLVLRFYRDKTLHEIGELMGISQNTAASCFRYGMEKLREIMAEETL
jgi:RNA polymerase sigma-70 factor, ECF subfamily